MSAVRLVRSSTLTPDVDYAYTSVVPAGTRLVHLAGACPLDVEGRTVAPGDPAAQARQVVANLVQALADVGATLTDVAYTRVLVASADRADLVAVWRVVRDAFGEHDVPSTLLGVTVLGYPDQLVEVEAVAALPEEPSARP
jgi:enamine deaminase RidA (YjgF/YER057c/UK114 family)